MSILLDSRKVDRTNLWLIQVLLTYSKSDYLFVIFNTGDIDSPILKEGKVVFYSRMEILENYFDEKEILLNDFCLEDHLDFIYDVRKLLNAITSLTSETAGYILDCLNLLFDVVSSIKIDVLTLEIDLLKDLADHLTFDNNILTFLEVRKITVNDILSFLHLSHKTILAHSCRLN